MNPDEFEKHLQRQPLRKVPDEWRSAILQKAPAAPHSSFVTRHSLLSTLTHQLSTILWPNAKAWAGLGCVWILIFALHAASRGSSPMLSQVPAPKAASIMMTLKDQEQTLVELIGSNPVGDADKPRLFVPQPRSEWCGTTARA